LDKKRSGTVFLKSALYTEPDSPVRKILESFLTRGEEGDVHERDINLNPDSLNRAFALAVKSLSSSGREQVKAFETLLNDVAESRSSDQGLAIILNPDHVAIVSPENYVGPRFSFPPH
jgi:hypothetical protein